MQSLLDSYHLLSSILSPKTTGEVLKAELSRNSDVWDDLVRLASAQLVLPAMHHQLLVKGLEACLPKSLQNFLRDVSASNRQRNQALLDQICDIARHFADHQIEYVFLKGSALLASESFEDLSERMLGDIDILIAPQQLQKAYELLLAQGYQKPPTSFGVDFFEHKHLPRLIPLEHTGIGAVELHSKLFQYQDYPPLRAERLLDDKRNYKGLSIPSETHLLLHNILNWQYNDYGSLTNTLSFRSAYDSLQLLQKYPSLTHAQWTNNRAIRKYFKIMRGFFEEVHPFESKAHNWYVRCFKFKLKHPKATRYYHKVLKFFHRMPMLWQRLKMFVSNQQYRSLVWQDRKRVWRLLFKV